MPESDQQGLGLCTKPGSLGTVLENTYIYRYDGLGNSRKRGPKEGSALDTGQRRERDGSIYYDNF